MVKYLLTVFGDFEDEKICKEIALSITPLVDSPHLKFNHTKGCLIFHFASEVSHQEIYDYLIGSLFDVTSSFILTEFTDNVSVYLPDDVKKHLLDLENNVGDVQIKIDLTKNLMNTDGLEWSDKENEFVALLLDEVKKTIKKPSLDQLLDKINKTGFDSLSPYEKEILDSYSK